MSTRTTHPSYCRICPALCGVLVDVEDDVVVRVKGDRRHPLSQGCWGAADPSDDSPQAGACVNALVDSESDLSPIVGMARQSAIPVWVERTPTERAPRQPR